MTIVAVYSAKLLLAPIKHKTLDFYYLRKPNHLSTIHIFILYTTTNSMCMARFGSDSRFLVFIIFILFYCFFLTHRSS